MKISKEAFLEQMNHDFNGVPENVEAVPCDCNMPYCEGWKLEMKEKDKCKSCMILNNPCKGKICPDDEE